MRERSSRCLLRMSKQRARAGRHRQGAELARAGIGAVGVLRRPCDALDVVRRRAVLLLDAAEDVERQRLGCHEAVARGRGRCVRMRSPRTRSAAVLARSLCATMTADGDQQHGERSASTTLIIRAATASPRPCSRDREPVRAMPDDREHERHRPQEQHGRRRAQRSRSRPRPSRADTRGGGWAPPQVPG